MAEAEVIETSSVQRNGPDRGVLVREVSGRHDEPVAVRKIERRARDLRTADHITASARVNWIEPKDGEHVPRRHLTGVVVAADAVGRRPVEFAADAPHRLVGLPRTV